MAARVRRCFIGAPATKSMTKGQRHEEKRGAEVGLLEDEKHRNAGEGKDGGDVLEARLGAVHEIAREDKDHHHLGDLGRLEVGEGVAAVADAAASAGRGRALGADAE